MIQVCSFSEAGGHDCNEDAFDVCPHPLDSSFWLAAIADGQGGRAGGAAAAKIACRHVIEAASRSPSSRLLLADSWRGWLREADNQVSLDLEAGFTTLIGLCVFQDQIVGASSGDSAAFLVDEKQTVILTEDQAKNPPIGSGSAAITTFATSMNRLWKVALVTDGVWKYAGWPRLFESCKFLRGRDLIEDWKVRARLPRTGRFSDDFTAVVVEDIEQ